MAKVERVSSMIEGIPCVILINGETKHFPVHEKENKKYITLFGKRMHEKDLPMGEEINI